LSAVDLLGSRPLSWAYQGATYLFASPDLDDELLYQAEHEAWAWSRVEAARAKVSPDVYASRCARLETMVAGNQFAFGGPLSIQFLASRAGMVEFLLLMGLKGGGERPTREGLTRIARSDPKEWDRLTDQVLRREFPNLMTPETAAPSSGAQETPSPSITESGCSSPGAPGSCNPERSAD
jgi:hypothetical protein